MGMKDVLGMDCWTYAAGDSWRAIVVARMSAADKMYIWSAESEDAPDRAAAIRILGVDEAEVVSYATGSGDLIVDSAGYVTSSSCGSGSTVIARIAGTDSGTGAFAEAA